MISWKLAVFVVLAAVLGTLMKLVVTLKLRLKNISERITSLIFLNIYLHSTTLCFDSYNSSLTLIIGICYCFNCIHYYFISLQYTLCHTFPFHILFSLYPTLFIGTFYCLNYASLLLDIIITHLVNTFYNNYVINICPRQLLRLI